MMPASSGWGAWVRLFRRGTSPVDRLIVFPHAGGSASFYRRFALAFPESIEVTVVQYPGRADRINEPHVDAMPELADELAGALLRDGPARPALFGHSMGAAVAYEVACRLERAGRGARVLFASGRQPPSRIRATAHHLAPDELLLDEICRLGSTNGLVREEPALRRLVLPTVRNDYRLIETYRPTSGTPLTCPVHALVAKDDTEVTVDEATAWAEVTAGPAGVHEYSGDHFHLVADPEPIVATTLSVLGYRRPPPATSWPDAP